MRQKAFAEAHSVTSDESSLMVALRESRPALSRRYQ